MPSFSAPRSYGTVAGCQHYRCGYGQSHNAATQVVVYIRNIWRDGSSTPTGEVISLCSRHAGNIRSLITRGSRSYSSDNFRFMPGDPNRIRPENVVTLALRERQAEQDAAAAARIARTAELRPQYREAYRNAVSIGNYQANLTNVNEYGLVHINVTAMQRMTPATARALAARLEELASEAEAASR